METLKSKTIDAVTVKFGNALTIQTQTLIMAAADIDFLVERLAERAEQVVRSVNREVIESIKSCGFNARPNNLGVLQSSGADLERLCAELHAHKECFQKLCIVVGVEVLS